MAVLTQKKPTTLIEKFNDETWRRRFLRNVLIPWIFIAPLLLLHIYVVTIPAVQGVYMSMTDWKGVGQNANFIGLENYRELFFEDQAFGKAMGNNIVWMIFFLTVPFILALFAATMLSQIKRGGMLYRSILFIPYVLASVVTITIWKNLLNPQRGIGAALDNLLGFGGRLRHRLSGPPGERPDVDRLHRQLALLGLLDDPLFGGNASHPAGALRCRQD